MLDENLPIDDIEVDDEDFSGGEEDLLAAIKSLKESEEEDDEPVVEDKEETPTEEEDDESEKEVIEEDEEVEEEPPTKKKQSKEENAKFAAQRRQAEIDKQVQAKLDELKKQSPEFQLAKELSDRYGKPIETIMAEMKEAALLEEAKEAKIPVDVLRRQRLAEEKSAELERQLNQLRYESWETKIKADGEKIKGEYTMLTDNDVEEAVSYILTTAKNVDMPLEQAVYALHGKKIVEALAKGKVQDELANQSGRKKKTPVTPSGGKTKQVTSLSSDEAYIAKQFGMTAEEYNKYKN